jgi:hypothetical protein
MILDIINILPELSEHHLDLVKRPSRSFSALSAQAANGDCLKTSFELIPIEEPEIFLYQSAPRLSIKLDAEM